MSIGAVGADQAVRWEWGVSLSLEQRSRAFWLGTGICTALLVGAVDYLTGYEISLSLFYLFPIAAVSWLADRASGVALSLSCAGIWLVAEIATAHPYSHEAILYWNAGIHFASFLVVALLLSALRSNLAYQERLARIDSTTGAANRRAFLDLLQREVDRASRYGDRYAIAYLDLDDFKQVNDHHGHQTGDQLLRVVAATMQESLRRTDSYARIGGDEFALLLPESGAEATKTVVSKVRRDLLASMRKHDWPVTFSIGALVVTEPVESLDELIGMADALMYEVKRAGKNSIRYAQHPLKPADAAATEQRPSPMLPRQARP